MFKIESRDLITSESRLLFDIRGLLIEINNKLDVKSHRTIEHISENKKPQKINQCKHCGKIHNNKGELMACGRKYNRKAKEGEVTNVV